MLTSQKLFETQPTDAVKTGLKQASELSSLGQEDDDATDDKRFQQRRYKRDKRRYKKILEEI